MTDIWLRQENKSSLRDIIFIKLWMSGFTYNKIIAVLFTISSRNNLD
jgi:hypothetical protein